MRVRQEESNQKKLNKKAYENNSQEEGEEGQTDRSDVVSFKVIDENEEINRNTPSVGSKNNEEV